MTYFVEKSDPESIFSIIREHMRCRCPEFTPVGIRIPEIDQTSISQQAWDEYSIMPFVVKAQCMRCRNKSRYFVPIEKMPIIDQVARDTIRKAMLAYDCTHEYKDWFVTNEVSFRMIDSNNHVAETMQDIHGRSYLHLLYCGRCRLVHRIFIPEDHIIR